MKTIHASAITYALLSVATAVSGHGVLASIFGMFASLFIMLAYFTEQ